MAEVIVVHGYPGSGKSTQCERLRQSQAGTLQVVHVSAGDRLREIRSGSTVSRFSSIINDPNAPSPLSDEIVAGAIFEKIPAQPAGLMALVDGYPRHTAAVGSFLNSIVQEHHTFLGTISLETSLETTVSRLLTRGARNGEKIRAGNLEEFAEKRYMEHAKETLRAVDRLAETSPVIQVDANAGIEVVWERFVAAVGTLAIAA